MELTSTDALQMHEHTTKPDTVTLYAHLANQSCFYPLNAERLAWKQSTLTHCVAHTKARTHHLTPVSHIICTPGQPVLLLSS